jgi:hypothetical protein
MARYAPPSETGDTARQAQSFPCYGERIADEIEANLIPKWDSETDRRRYEREREKRGKRCSTET